MRVIIGGTFAHLHKGHIALLTKAFESGDYIYIGLTTDEYVKGVKGGGIPAYSERERVLKEFVGRFKKKFEIVPLSDRFGPSITGDFDAIVVSEETFGTARMINDARRANGLKELRIIKIDYVLAEDSVPISTTRIVKGEIDREGRLIRL